MAVTTAFLVQAAIKIAIGLAIQKYQTQQQKRRLQKALQGQQRRPATELRQAASPLQFGLGVFRPDRALVFLESKGVPLFKLGVISGVQIGGIVDYIIDSKKVTVGVDGQVVENPYVYLFHKDGSGLGGDYGDLIYEFAADDVWTSDHDLTGFATILSRFNAPDAQILNRIFPRAEYTDVTAIVKDVPRYDPRTGTNVETTNAGVNLLAFAMHPYGLNLPLEAFNLPQFAAYANLSDTARETTPGQSRPLYQISGLWDATLDAGDVLGQMLICADASMYQRPDGLVGIAGGQYIEPDVTFTDEDIISIEENIPGVSPLDRRTIATGSYYGPESGYAPIDFPEVVVGDTVTYGERRERFDLPFVPDYRQAMDIAKRELARNNPDKRGRAVLRGSGIKALFPPDEGYHVARLTSDAFGFDEVVEVLSVSVTPEAGEISVTMEWQSIDPTLNDRDAAIETATGPTPIDDLGEPTPDYFQPTLDDFALDGRVLSLTIDAPARGDLILQYEYVVPDDPVGDPTSYTGWSGLQSSQIGELTGAITLATDDELEPYLLVRLRFRQGDRGPYNYWLLDMSGGTFSEVT